MSADNGIYILKTIDSVKTVNINQIPVYRVAICQAIENYDYFKYYRRKTKFEKYLKDNWGKSPVFYNEEDVWKVAGEMYREITTGGYVEYGVQFIDCSDIDFNSINKGEI